jgi:hypothetical protein
MYLSHATAIEGDVDSELNMYICLSSLMRQAPMRCHSKKLESVERKSEPCREGHVVCPKVVFIFVKSCVRGSV